MNFKIAVLSGDGIGPEVVEESIKALKAIEQSFGHKFELTYAPVGAIAIDETGIPLPESTLELCKESDAILFGSIGDPKYDNDPSAKVRPEQGLLKLRKELGLFANIRPVKAFDSLIEKSPLKKEIIQGTDMVIYRELTGGIYFGEKKLSDDKKVASDLCEYSASEVERISHLAFQSAQTRRKKVTLVDKANVLESSRLWRRVVTEIAKEYYPDVTLEFLFVDNAAMQLILNPSQFDVILTENMFGDILSDQGSVIGGSIGLLASASKGEKSALFEPIHGSYPQAKGKNIANPIASILSTSMMLEHLGLFEEAKRINEAVEICLSAKIVTEDLNKSFSYSTQVVGDAIAELIVAPSQTFTIKENMKIGKSIVI